MAEICHHTKVFYSPALKTLCYTGFAFSFRHSFRPSFLPSAQLPDTFSSQFFSRNISVAKLKLGTHIPNGLMFRVYRNQGQGPITLGVTSLDWFYNLNFRYRFPRNYESCNVDSWYTNEQWALGVTSPHRFYNLPLMKMFCHTFIKNLKGYKVET